MKSGLKVRRRGLVLAVVGVLLAATAASAGSAAAAPPGSTSADDASFVSQSVPASMACGETGTVAVTMRNPGTTTWTKDGGYALETTTSDTWGISYPPAVPVAPREKHTFQWSVTAPSAAGTYDFGWRMAVAGVRFGETTAVVSIVVSCDGEGGGTSPSAGPLADLFEGRAQLAEDERFSVSDPGAFRNGNDGPGHIETDSVRFGTTYYLFFRTFVHPDGTKSTNGVPAGIAMATSADGHAWAVRDGGKPVIAARASSATSGCDPSPCTIAIYAPSVIVDGTELRIVYETMDTGVVGPSATPRHWIETATSTDGITWSTPVKILEAALPWEGFDGQHKGNVGTPQLTKEADLYRLDYHGFSADHQQLARGFATGTSMTDLTRSAHNPTLTPTTGWNSFGPGRNGLVKEGGYWYRVFEGFKGSAQCVRTDTVVGWGLARSTDLVTWEHSASNPIRTDRIHSSCGEDMPNWQVLDGEAPMVTTTNYDHPTADEATVKRYRIVAKPSPTSPNEVVTLAQAATAPGYWQLVKDGRVHAFGGAVHHGNATASTNSTPVDITPTPDGDGYWVASDDGKVQAFGAAVHHGNGRRGTVGIDATPTGGGYWTVDQNGSVRPFGDADNHGSLPSAPSKPIVGMAGTVDGGGYWLVGADGQVYPFGNAGAHGSLPAGSRSDIVGMGTRPDGQGYWVVAATGQVWSFNAASFGSTNGWAPSSAMRVVGIGPRATGSGGGDGYLLVAADGGVIDFGLARYRGHVRGPGWNQ